MSKIRVLILAQCEAERAGASVSLGQCAKMDVIGAVSGCKDATALVQSRLVDVVLVADRLAQNSAFEAFAAMLKDNNVGLVSAGCLSITKRQSAFCPIDARNSVKVFEKLFTSQVGATCKTCPRPLIFDKTGAGKSKVVLIGASTGGIEALLQVLASYSVDCPPTLIVQHIGAEFVKSLADRLDRKCAAKVQLARHGLEISHGNIYVAPDNAHHLTLSKGGHRCSLLSAPPRSGHRPSVDVLFESGSNLGNRTVGVLLTGMGRDGADGLLRIRQQGGTTIAQDEASSTVYGMPRVAFELGAVERQLPIEKIGPHILKVAEAKPEVRGIAQT